MSKTEYAWIIQRDDGMYCVITFAWSRKICYASQLETLQECELAIKEMNLQNCKPVKVRIEIVGEWYVRE